MMKGFSAETLLKLRTEAIPIAKYNHILEYETETDLNPVDGILEDLDYDELDNIVNPGIDLECVDDGSVEDVDSSYSSYEQTTLVKFDSKPDNNLNWDEWAVLPAPPSDCISDSESEESLEDVGGAILVDTGPKESLTPNRKKFWEHQANNVADLGFNNRKVVRFHLDGEKTKYGYQKTHWKDKVQCDVCGSIYRRNLSSSHRKTKKHNYALTIHKTLFETLMRAPKTKVYYKKYT